MTKFALKGLLGRKLRTVLTAIAIVLGVAMVAGTFVLTDSIDKAFDSIFTDSRKGSDLVISGKSAFDISDDSGSAAPTLPDSLVETVRGLDGVSTAEGSVDGTAQLIGDNGKAIVYGGAPNLGFSIANADSPFNPLTLVEGAWPGPNEVVIDKSTAGKEDFKVGDIVSVQARGPIQRLRLSGLVKFGTVSTIGGATLSGFDLATAQRLFNKVGRLDEIAVATKPGVPVGEVEREVKSVLPADAQVLTGTQQASEDASDTNSFITFLRIFLLVFGGIALFVGAFVIANSLSITVAQRTREFATLRTIGASRRQIRRSVLVESLVLGLLASLVGLVLGLALAKGLFWLFEKAGFTLPNSGLLLETRTVIVALVVGVLVTVVASLRPARRATRVPPIAAVREGATLPPGRFARYRPVGSALLGLLGFALLAYGLFGSGLSTTGILVSMGIGTLLIFFGVAFFSSQLVVPLAHLLGGPAARIGGAPGILARDNAMRNPQRTASTASALMIGLALVTLVAMLAQGIRGSFFDAVNKIWVTDYAVTAQNNYSPIPISVSQPLRQSPNTTAVVGVRAGEGRILGGTDFLTGVDPGASKVFRLDWTNGSPQVMETLGDRGAFTDEDFAKDHDLTIGSPVEVQFPSGDKRTFSIKGIFDPPTGGSPFGPITISSKAFDESFQQPKNLFVFITTTGGETEANTAELKKALTGFPNAKLQNRDEFKDNQFSGIATVLNVLYVLLALSVIVSLFGIVNTLVLSVFERTREIGMLRAVGTTRWQVRAMITFESIVTALMGAAIGIALGVVLAALLIYRVDFLILSWPIGSLIVFALAAIVVGVIAAVLPARRAAKLNVLQALQYE